MADRGRQGSMSAVTAIALAPWRLSQQWVSWWFGMIFSALSRAGVTPAGFVEQAKVGGGAAGRRPAITNLALSFLITDCGG